MRLGLFDSGIGGMTVLVEIRKKLPRADLVYFGDTANVPYGGRSEGQVRALSTAAVHRLASHGVGAVVVACNTASALAFPEIQAALGSIPVLGVVEAGVRAAVSAARARGSGPILVLATRATVRSGLYSRLLQSELPAGSANPVIEKACPLLVPMIEEGWGTPEHPILRKTVEHYVAGHSAAAGGVALLACTHYPWIENVFQRALPGWTVVNSAACVAEAVADRFGDELVAGTGSVEWIFTDPDVIPDFARRELDRLRGSEAH